MLCTVMDPGGVWMNRMCCLSFKRHSLAGCGVGEEVDTDNGSSMMPTCPGQEAPLQPRGTGRGESPESFRRFSSQNIKYQTGRKGEREEGRTEDTGHGEITLRK